MLKKRNLIVLTVIILVSIQTITSQCAMCKAVLETGDVSMAEGVNNGISYLMVFPYLLIGTLFFVIYRYKKNAKN
jgi:hypothetical protein|tara:strand:+ start:792 stop:1016 length:225 start_codon:yes stop_codon:yes gene_type:complete